MSKRLQWLVVALSSGLILEAPPVKAESRQQPVLQVRDLPRSAVTVKEWLSQQPETTAPIRVIDVRLNPTQQGLEVILQTETGQELQASQRSQENTLILTVPNAVLALSSGQAFEADNPIEGISRVAVAQTDATTLQVSIAGVNDLPTAEVVAGQGLVLAVTPEVGNEEEITVTGEGQRGYRVPNASTATKIDTPLRDIPQSIQVVPRQVLEDRQPTNLVDALRSVPGISQANQPSTSIYEGPIIRGFQASEFDVLRNGFPSPNFTISNFDSATVERIEVLRGPASVLFGQGSLGGVINVITKQPLSEPQYSVEASIGNFDRYRGAIDLTGPLTDDKKVRYRLNFSGRNTGSFLDFFNRQQFTVAPVISWQIGDNTNLKLSAEYINISGSYGQMGLPARGTILPNPNGKIPFSRSLSEPYDRDDAESFRVGYDLEHKFSNDWQLRSVFEIAWLEQDRVIVFPVSLGADNRTLQRRILSGSPIDTRNIILDNYVVGKFATGSVQHQLLAGFNYTRTDQESFEQPGARLNLAPIDIFSPIYNQPSGASFGAPFAGESSSNAYGFYLQDQISLTSNFKVLLGGRFDIANQRIVNNFGADGSAQQEVFSPRVGIVYQPIPSISLYAAYGRSFLPIINAFESGTISKPERGKLYEVGVKADLSDRISATLAFYDQTRTNIRTQDPNDPLRVIQVGEQKSQGIELNLAGEILPGWNIIAGYAYTDARIEQDNSFPVGNRINGVPENSFNLWTTYRIQSGSLRGLGVGLGLFYQGERQGNLANTFQLPSYLRTDAAIFYERDRFRAGLNFRNLFNIEYYEAAININRVFPGSPLEVQGTVSWTF